MNRLVAGSRSAARWLALVVLAAAGAGLGGGLAAPPALASSFVTVTTTADETAVDGACSLREAILYAQNMTGGDTDCGTVATGTTTIIVPAGHYAVGAASGDARLPIGAGAPGPVVIAGVGATGTVIDAQGTTPRLLLVGSGATVIIRDLTLQGGVEPGPGAGIDNLSTLTLDHVTVTGNRTRSLYFPGFGGPLPDVPGGGIYNTGTLNLVNAVVSGNSTDNGHPGLGDTCFKVAPAGTDGGNGGGIYNEGGTVNAIYTTIADNATGAGGHGRTGMAGCTSGGVGGLGGAGGGIYNDHGTVILRQSAVYANTTGDGGEGGDGFGSIASGISGFGGMGGTGGAGAGILNDGQLTVTDTTITGNVTGNGSLGGVGPSGVSWAVRGRTGGGGVGGAIAQFNGAATVQESTVASNLTGTGDNEDGSSVPSPGAGSGFYVGDGVLTEIDTIVSNDDCATFLTIGQIKDGMATGDGHLNLSWPTATCPGIIANPLLQPLHDNGGPTQTMAIAPPSPALDRIPPTSVAGCTPADQRGTPRPQPTGGRCDIGAFEEAP